jgi:hypothetical protein
MFSLYRSHGNFNGSLILLGARNTGADNFEPLGRFHDPTVV